jgi:bacteriorhodopsin
MEFVNTGNSRNGTIKGKVVDGKPTTTTTQNAKNKAMKASFVITYILLLTTATITFIEAIRTQVPYVRHILNLETAISVIAGYFYGIFIAQIDKASEDGEEFDWSEITKTRYIDWSITTPLMLLALCLVLSNEVNVSITLPAILTIVGLNYIMLYLGYLGETGVMQRIYSDVFGFGVFFSMFYLIYRWYVAPRFNRNGFVLFCVYLLIWSLYGVVYMFDEIWKNTITNILDLTAKCLVGLGLWMYYTKIIR